MVSGSAGACADGATAPSAAQPESGGPPAFEAAPVPRPRRIAVVGVSTSSICGVRDHAGLLAAALERQGVRCSMHWHSHSPTSLRAAGLRTRAWTRALGAELGADPPDAVLLHYSVFAYSQRGVPVFVHPTLSAVRRARVPLLTVLHEFAYPWGRRGWRGAAWALSQRALLVELVRVSSALMLTTDFQRRWVVSRPWLPRRPSAVAPVFSNLPAATVAGPPAARTRQVVGLFGYSAEGAAVAPTLDAVRGLAARGVRLELCLLGAPGPDSPAGETWRRAARAREVAHALSFSGILPPQELADALAMCEVLLFAETAGPTTRKTTLAASLAAGRPVLALDGPSAWPELARAEAARIVQPTGPALAGAIGEMLADQNLREMQGARGRAFAEERMSAAGNARIVRGVLEEILAQCMVDHVERAVR